MRVWRRVFALIVLEGLEAVTSGSSPPGGEALATKSRRAREKLNIKHDNPYSI